jgi:hypothetical protein
MKKKNKCLLWMSFSSVKLWDDPVIWDKYLRNVELILGDVLTKLDENDPVRRKADVSNSEGEYITTFQSLQGTRYLFGEFAKTQIKFTLYLNKELTDQWCRPVYNNIKFYIPISEKSVPRGVLDQLVQFFQLTIEKLEAFYAYSDLKEEIMTKKSQEGGAMDIATELPGIFWLTYFGPKYCEFFERDRLLALPVAHDGPGNGIVLRLAETPERICDEDRRNAEIFLGEKYFAGVEPITDFNKKKAYNQLLTLDELRK